MKKLLLLLFFCVFSFKAEAALPVTDQTLPEAIAYGKGYQGENNAAAILQPWTIAESFKTNPYGDEEQIIVYTPYLLAALDIAGKTPADNAAEIAAAKELVASFEGVLVIRAVINTPIILKDEDLEVQLVQKGNFVVPYHSDYIDAQYFEKAVSQTAAVTELQQKNDRMETIKEKAAILQKQLDDLKNNKIKTANIDLQPLASTKDKVELVEEKQKICRLQYNFYFDESEFDASQPYLLLIKDDYCGGREFAVDPMLLK